MKDIRSMLPLKKDKLPLSTAQKSLWYGSNSVADAGCAVFKVAGYEEINGAFDVELFCRVIQYTMESIDSLNVTFDSSTHGPMQSIDPVIDWHCPVLNFQADAELEKAAKSWMRTEQNTPFNLQRGPLISMAVLRLSFDRVYFYLSAHHLVMDGYGCYMLLRYISATYLSKVIGEPLPPFKFTRLSDLLKAHEIYDASLQRQRDKEYWLNVLSDRPIPIGLGSKQMGRPTYELKLVRSQQRIPQLTHTWLHELANEYGTTLAQLLTALISIYIYKLTGESDLVIGFPTSGRSGRLLRSFLGTEANVLPLRLSINAELTLTEFLKQVRQNIRNLLKHQRYRGEDLRSDLDSGLLYTTSVNIVPCEYETSFCGGNGRGYNLSAGPADGLSITVYDRGLTNELELCVDANDSEFCQQDVDRHASRLLNFLSVIKEQSYGQIGDIDILSKEERKRVLGYNKTSIKSPAPLFIHQLFEVQVVERPNAVALELFDETLTYQALNIKANQLAHLLIDEQVNPGDYVGIYLPRSLDAFVSMLAIMKSGAAYVMLDIQQPYERLQALCKQADLRVILSHVTDPIDHFDDRFMAHAMCLDDQKFQQRLVTYSNNNPQVYMGENAPALIYFTSGSTGIPKGAINSHTGVINTMWAMSQELELTSSDRVLQFAALSFDVVIEEVFPAWFSGAAVVLRDEEGLLSPEQLQAMLTRLDISVCELMSSYWSLWVDYLTEQNKQPPKSFRTVILGSDAVLMPAYNTWQAFDVPIVNVFGLTETGCTTLTYKAQGPQGFATRLPNGRPLPNTQVYILDVAGNPVPEGVMGELCIGGVGVGLGYVGAPELTAERFVQNPFSEGSLYKTGDLARWLPGGLVEFIGRRDQQVKLRGFRIELGEIEAQLLNQAMIREAVVVLDDNGETERLVAYVTANATLDVTQLRQTLNNGLPEYMVPSIYIELDVLPITASGKVDRKALPKPEEHHLSHTEYEAPQGVTENVLAEIWQELLPVEQVSRHDNFFRLGGHSLLIIRLIAELQAKDLHTDIRTIFDNPVLKELAAAIATDSQACFQAPANLIPADCAELTPDLLPLVALEQGHINNITSQVPGGAANIQDIYPLGPLQEGILFHHLLSSTEQGDTYIMPILLSTPDDRYADRFIRALNAVIARHDVLRTAVFWDDLPRPVQVVLRESPIVVNTLTLDASQGTLSQLHEHAAPGKLWMDLSRAPLLQLDMAADPHSDQVFLILYGHHIINDHIGLEILIDEIEAYLDAEAAGEVVDLPVQAPYREFIAHTLMLAESAATQAYFESRLGDVDEPTLPFGLQDTQVDAAEINDFDYVFEDAFSYRLKVACTRLSISMASVFHLAWALVLGRCSGRDDVVFGTVLSGRLQGTQGADLSIGLFINTLPLRLKLSGKTEAVLKHTHDELLNLLEHEQASLALVHEYSKLSGEVPLFTTLLNYRRDELDDKSLLSEPEVTDDAAGVVMLGGYERTNYPLTLSVDDLGGEQFSLNLQAVTEIDGERMIGYIRTALEGLITSVMQNDTPLKDLAILPEIERQDVLVGLNHSQAEYPDNTFIHTLFEAQVKTSPNAVALVYEGKSLTYEQLNQHSNQLAHYLIEQGVKPDTLVGLCLDRSVEMVIGLLGILKAGGAYVPLDPHSPVARLQYQIDDANLNVILTQEALQSQLEGYGVETVCLDVDDVQERLKGYSIDNPACQQLGQHLVYAIYTSGTTGQPKGVMVEHQALTNFLYAMKDRLGDALMPGSQFLAVTTIAFDIAGLELWGPLSQGGQIVLASRDDLLAPANLISLLESHQIACMQATPSTWQSMIDVGWPGQPDLSVLCGGEALPEPLAEQLASRCDRLLNCYGPTEATIWSLVKVVDEFAGGTLGGALSNYSHYVLDQHLQPVPVGVVGELFIGGAGLARGYLNQPELTAEKFIANPFYDTDNSVNSERLYKTGDLVRWLPDGNLEFLGRIDHQVKLRGFRIELGEIEAQLLNHAAVREAVVLLDENEGAGRLVAYVTAHENSELESEQLRQALSDSLPEYMVPVIYIELEALPLTSNGKVDRKALPKPVYHHLSHAEYEAPQGDTEMALAEIWQSLLKVEQVSRYDNFFSLGGHSLLVIRLLSSVQQHLERTLTLQNVFERPVLKDLSKVLDQAELSNQTPITLADRSQPLPLSWAQQRLWFIAQLEGGNAAYHIPGAVRLTGELSNDALHHALQTIVARHESLRTVFNEADGEVRQEITASEDAVFNLQHCDLRAVEDQEGRLQQEAEAEHQAAFDLATGPLIRGRLVQLADQDHVLLVTMHHIVSDGWSMGVLIQEFNALYEAYRSGQSSPLHSLPIQYADYAVWQRTELRGDVLARQSEYWQKHLADVPELLNLPTDHPRPAMPSYRGGIVDIALDAPVSKQVRALALREGMTVHMVLHAVWATLLSRLSGQEQVVVGTPVANRQRHEVEGLIGFFVNTLALRIDMTTVKSVESLLAQVKSATLDGYANQDIPFEQVVEFIQPERSLRYAPLFQVMFNFEQGDAEGALSLSGLSSDEMNLGSDAIAQFDVTLSLSDDGQRIAGQLEYARDLFERATIERWARYFSHLVTAFVNQLDTAVYELPMMSETERRHLLEDLNQTQAEYPDNTFIHTLFEAQVKTSPNAVALVYEGKSLTYEQLNQHSNQLAHYLIEQGVKPDTLVGLCLDRSVEMVIGLLGILKAGGAYVPLDPHSPVARLQYQIDDANLNVILTQEALQSQLEGYGVETVCLDVDDVQERLKGYSIDNPACQQLGQHLVYAIYTSGTTGQPKGVMVEHQALTNFLYAMKDRLGDALMPGSQFLAVTTIAFDIAGLELWGPLSQGGQIVLASRDDLLAPANLISLLESHQIACMQATPSTWQSMIDVGWPGQPDLSVLCGGEALPEPLAEQLASRCDRLLNCYGPTEATIWSLVKVVDEFAGGTLGGALSNYSHYVLDQHLQPVPVGVVGELFIGGAGLARGYLNQPELTAEKFIANPFYDTDNSVNSERLYKTGDLVRWLPDGNLEFLGRIDHQVKLRGFRIELGEIEAQLLNHAAVREAVVLLDENEGAGRLVAYVTAHENSELESEQLRQALSDSLPEYMVPVIYIELEALPLTSNGKVDRKALPKPVYHHLSHAEYEAPQGDTEMALAEIWQSLLKVEQVSRYDNFFSLGGHSLLVIRLLSSVQQHLERTLTLQNVFERPVLKDLSKVLDQAELSNQTPITLADRSQPLPLSWAQQRLWFIAQLEGGNAAYHIPGAVRLTGELSNDALHHALQTIVARHESLRTVFNEADGEVRQEITASEDAVFNLQHCDLRAVEDQEGRLQQEAEAEHQAAFDLATGPLIRGRLVQLADQDHVLLVTMHHIVSDGWSMGVLIQEFNALYEAYRSGQSSPLHSLPIQYADYAVWQRTELRGDVLARQSEYWQKHLADVPELLNLPTDHPRPAMPSYRGGIVDIALDAPVSKQVRALALREGMTVHMVLHAVWATLLSRLSGQEQVVVGTPVANRQRHEVEGLIGFFVNTLALRIDMTTVKSVESLLAQVKSATLDGYANQDIPFEQVVEFIQPERSLRYAPLFQVMFNFEQGDAEGALSLSGLSSDEMNLGSDAIAQFDVTLSLSDDGQRIAGQLEYARDLFERATIERWARYFSHLVTAFVNQLDTAVYELPMMSETERRHLLEDLNQTQAEYPDNTFIHTLFEAQVKTSPNAVALVYEGKSLTYEQLNQHSNQLAHYLIEQGVKPDTLVGLCLDRSVEMVIGLLGILKAGGAYVPLDPHSPVARLQYQIDDANLNVILTQEALQSQLEGYGVETVCLDVDDVQERLKGYSIDNPACQQLGQHLVYAIYTSGTTGQPKGVMVEHQALTNFLYAMKDRLGDALMPGSQFLAVTTIAFDIAGLELWGPLSQGGQIVLASRDDLLAPANLISLLESHQIACMQATPSTWQSMIDVGWPGQPDLSVLCGGEALPEPLAEQLASRCDRLLNCYGPTEATIWSLVKVVDEFAGGTLGGALSNYSHYVLDQHLQPVPVGVVGELFIGGAGLARGYLNQPELTAEKFIANPFYDTDNSVNSERLYKTGDLVRWLPDGNLEFLGRIDHQVKLRGFRIELGEIEAQLLNHAAVREAVVLLDENEGAGRLVAYVTAHENSELESEQLRQALSDSLPEYMVPVIYIELEALPLTSNGKVDRKALPKPVYHHLSHAEYEAPQGDTEMALAEIWQSLLKVEQVSRYDNFFSLGGHSLLVIRLLSSVQQHLERTLTLQNVFERPVLKDLSKVLDQAELSNQTPITLADRSQPLPLSWAQQRLWFIAQLEGGNAAYHIPGAVRLTGELSNDALHHALQTIVARHESLRTVFNEADGEVRQEITASEDAVFNLQHCDLRAVEDQEGRLQQEAEAEHQAAFDLATGPLIRGRLVQLADQDHVLLVTMHHIVSDGWSMGVLIQEFNALYEAYRSGQSSPLHPLPIQYADYAVWQRTELRGDVLARQSEYWQKHLADVPELLNLPTDHPRPAMPSYRGGIVDIALDAPVSKQVRALALREGMTVHMVLHAVWATLLSRLSGQEQVVVGTPVANRQRHEVEGLIGFFVNTLALRIDMTTVKSVESLLAQVKSATLDGYANQDIPFEQVVEFIQPERSLRYAPLFQVMFNFEQGDAEGALSLSGLSSDGVDINTNTDAQFDLTLSLSDDGKSITGHLEYASDLFNQETVERWSIYFSHLVTAFVSRLDTPVHDLPMLPETERHYLLDGLNQTQAAYPDTALIHTLFENQVVANPARIALVYEEQGLTYAVLNERANQLAHHLMELGVKPDTLVGLCVERSDAMIVAVLGILKAGGAYVPLDPSYPKARLLYQIEDTSLSVILTQESLYDELLAQNLKGSVQAVCLDADAVKKQLKTYSNLNPFPEEQKLNSRNLAYVIYTSGTTGQPKGVMIEHRSLCNLTVMQRESFHLSSAFHVLQFASIAFDGATWEMFLALAQGGTLVVPNHVQAKSPEALSELVEQHQVTHAALPPSLLPLLDIKRWAVVKTLVVAGEACAKKLAVLWSQDRKFVNSYGPSEYTVCATEGVFIPSQSVLHMGQPNQNTQVYVCDDNGSLLPQGLAGELLIGGVGLARGYLHQPELTAEKFIPNPFYAADNPASSKRLYKTGDLVRWLPDGNLEFLGRIDHQVKLRGFRIELGEIEAQLLNQAVVRDAVVVLDENGGEGRLVAYAAAVEGLELDSEQLRQALSESLPEYMVPEIYMELEVLPLTSNGKVNRKALPKPESHHLAHAAYEAPQGVTENVLAEIWQELLPVEQVSRHDNFFRLGGHSLLIIRLIAELQAKDLHTDIRTIFDNPVLKELAAAIATDSQACFQAPANLIPADCAELTPDLLPLVALEQGHINNITSQVPGGAANIQDIYPLGPLQEGILFHHLLSSKEQGDSYILPTLLSAPNSLYVDQFIQALNAVIGRHDVLRTAVFWDDLPRPVQVVLRESPIVVNTLTLDASQDTLTQLREHMAPGHLWMNLTEAPLLRMEVAADPHSDEIYMLICQHHIINDHIGLDILIDEVNAYLRTEGGTLDLPVPYREFIAHTLMLSESGATQAYFESRLGDVDEPTLPFGLQDTQVEAAEIVEFNHAFDDGFSFRLKAVCTRLGISMASVFHMAWALVLGRCSGRDDVVFGTVFSGRLQGTQGAARSIGLFINTLPLRLKFTGYVEEALKQTHHELLNLLEHEQASLALLRDCTDLSSEAPLITTLLNYRRDEPETPENKEVIKASNTADETNEVTMLDGYERTNYPLTLSVGDLGGEQFSLNLQAVAEIDGERVIGYMRTALDGIISSIFDDVPIKELDILPKVERQQLLVELNQTQAEYPDNTFIHTLFEAQVKTSPNAVALVYEGKSLTYEQLNQHSNQLAHYLIEQGVKPDTLVGLCLDRSVEMVIGLLGILKAGGAYVPLDPTYPQARLDYMTTDAGLTLVLTQQHLQDTVLGVERSQLQALCLDDIEQHLAVQPKTNLDAVSLGAHHLAYVIYTSGTTGNPKGVMIEHRSLCNLTVMQKASFNLSAACYVLQFASIAFDAATWEVFMALAQGATLVVPSNEQAKSPEALSALVERHQVTHATLPPSLLTMLDVERWAGVKTLVVAGEACAKQLADTWSQDRQFVNAYGPSEFTVCATAGTFSPSQAVLHMGQPNQNTQVYVCGDDGSLLPQGVPGELLLGGVGLARGYLNRPELTAEKFIENPFYDVDNPVSSDRLYRTGDLVRWLPDSNLEFLGRIDQQVKLRGFRIELGEIEAQLLNQAEVRETVVILDETGADSRLVAYVTTNEEGTIDNDQLRQALGISLPEYMVPSIYIELEALPLTSNGKVNRRALPKPESHHLAHARYEAPQGTTEVTLAEIWQDLLKVEQVSRHDNFFSLGGNSLLAIRLVSLVQQRLERSLTLQNLFGQPVLKDLSQTLKDNEHVTQAPISQVSRAQSRINQAESSIQQPKLPVEGAKLAPDGHFYIEKDGKYYRVDP